MERCRAARRPRAVPAGQRNHRDRGGRSGLRLLRGRDGSRWRRVRLQDLDPPAVLASHRGGECRLHVQALVRGSGRDRQLSLSANYVTRNSPLHKACEDS